MGILSKIFNRQIEMYEFTHRNVRYYFTSSDRPVVFLSHTYQPATIKRSSISATSSETKKQITLTTTKDFQIAKFFRKFNPSEIVVKVYRASRDDLNDYNQMFEGLVTSSTLKGNTASLVCKPYTMTSSNQICRYAFSTKCNHHVYNGLCGLDIEDFSIISQISSINSDGITFTVSDYGGNQDGYYQNGVITVPNGDSRQIIEHVGNQIKVMSPFEDVSVNDTIRLSAGCDRTSSVCSERFNNFDSFLGFEYVPDRNPYTDGV